MLVKLWRKHDAVYARYCPIGGCNTAIELTSALRKLA